MSAFYWEMISDKLAREGFAAGHVRFYDEQGREIWSAEASRTGKRWIVHAENLSVAFLEFERQTRDAADTPTRP